MAIAPRAGDHLAKAGRVDGTPKREGTEMAGDRFGHSMGLVTLACTRIRRAFVQMARVAGFSPNMQCRFNSEFAAG